MRKSNYLNPRGATKDTPGLDWAGLLWNQLGFPIGKFDSFTMFDAGLWGLGTREWL